MIYIIAPYRNRPTQLLNFIEHYTKFLDRFEYKIIIVEQANDKQFNKGLLLNCGIKAINEKYTINDEDILILNDIDCLIKEHKIDYYFLNPENNIRHIYGYTRIYFNKFNCLGGIISMKFKTFKHIHGFPNNFWGWGGEDLALGWRSKNSNIYIDIYGMISFGNNNDIIHLPNPVSKQSNIYKRISNKININKLLIETKNPKSAAANGYNNCSFISVNYTENENHVLIKLNF
jgi:hypothetical protein